MVADRASKDIKDLKDPEYENNNRPQKPDAGCNPRSSHRVLNRRSHTQRQQNSLGYTVLPTKVATEPIALQALSDRTSHKAFEYFLLVAVKK